MGAGAEEQRAPVARGIRPAFDQHLLLDAAVAVDETNRLRAPPGAPASDHVPEAAVRSACCKLLPQPVRDQRTLPEEARLL
jgi:hypothetical protein